MMTIHLTPLHWLLLLILNVSGDQELLYITHNSINKYDITNNITTSPIRSQDKGFSNLNDIDFDFELQIMFYLVDMKKIYSYNLISRKKKLILQTKEEIERLSVDWVTKKIYYSVSDRKRIVVCSYDGKIQKILFQRPLLNLKAICVSPKYGYLFFSHMGYDAKIERADMDGTNPVALVTDYISMPVALAADPRLPIIYWIDAYESQVEMIHMDGTHRKVLLSGPQWDTLSSIAVLESRMFFLRNPNGGKGLGAGIISCLKFNDTIINCTTVVTSPHYYASIRPYGKDFQPFMTSGCGFKNHPCSHLCLLKPAGYSCVCPTGYKINEDNKTCSQSFKKFIIFATKPDLRLISLDVRGRFDMTLPVKSKRKVYAVDYDPQEKMVYWTEVKTTEFGVIKRATLDGKVIEEVVSQGYTLPEHLAIDWVAKNLYWTCPNFKKIYVSRLDGSSNMVIINKDLRRPRGIAVDPGDGRLYWSDWGKGKEKIESSDLDGTKREVLVDSNLVWPNGITLDYHKRHLYWVDAGTDKIEYYDLSEKTRKQLNTASPHAFGISILDGKVYWTDWQQRSLYQFDKESGVRTKIVDSVPDIMGIKAVDTTLYYGKNICGNNNFGCSHFCFHKPNEGGYCACPSGYHLTKDKKTCKAVTGFILFATKTSINTMSFNANSDKHMASKILGNDISYIATHTKTNRVYWVEDLLDGHRASAIKSAPLNNSRQREVLQTGFSDLLGGIALDWMSENMYWSQIKLHRIEVSRMDGRFKKVIVNDTSASIRHLTIDPFRRRLYWFEENSGHTEARLISANLTGGNRIILENITSAHYDSTNVYGLTVDVNDSRVYWMAGNKLGSISWTGTNKSIQHLTLLYPSGMKVYQNNIYICEEENPQLVALTISSVDKRTAKKTQLMYDQSNWCRGITVFHNSLQQGENVCSSDNGGCDHLCFAVSLIERKCECETHYTLSPVDNTSCIAPSSFLLIGQKDIAFRFLPSEQSNLALDLKASSTNIGTIGYNIRTERFYWLEVGYENNVNSIKYLNQNRNNINTVSALDLLKSGANPVSFTVDFFTDTIYWVDGSDHSISFLRLSEPVKHGIIFKNPLYKPIKIVSLPEEGILIFVNSMSVPSSAKEITTIESLRMDGSSLHRIRELVENTECDVSVDYVKKRLYWLDLNEKKIESADLQGSGSEILMQFDKKNFKPLTITIYGDTIYWIDKKQRDSQAEYLKWRNLRKELNDIYSIRWEYKGSQDLHAVQTNRLLAEHPCKTKNGGCSHICFKTSNRSQCGCPFGYGFLDDKRTQCERKNSVTCVNICSGVCMASNTPCEKLVNCTNIEENYTDKCSCVNTTDFICLDGPCILPKSAMCDGKNDCRNNIDEDKMICTNTAHTKSPSRSSSKRVNDQKTTESTTDKYSPYTAGIISGTIFTALMFTCALYVVCKFRRKNAELRSEENKTFLQAKLKSATESVFVVTPSRAESSVITDTYISRNVTPSTNDSYPMRYITGSSTNMTDCTSPCNPPPTIVSSNHSLSSVNEYLNDDQISVQIPVPPATPLYVPSDVESVITNDLDSIRDVRVCESSIDRSHVPSCVHCAQQQQKPNYLYTNCRNPTRKVSESGDSSCNSYTEDVPNRHANNSCCEYEQYIPDKYIEDDKTFHRKPSSYHPPSLVSDVSSFSHNTLPRVRMSHGATRRLVPSVVSDLSRSESSVVTVRQKDNSPMYNDTSSSYYETYGPPPSPGLEFVPELNDFKDFKDEEEEALENDLLIESHRPQTNELF